MAPSAPIPLDQWSGSAATRELHETIRAFNDQAAKQTAAIIRLTWILVVLTALMLVGLVVQIVLAV
jgi:CHASE3 domain sensor protein